MNSTLLTWLMISGLVLIVLVAFRLNPLKWMGRLGVKLIIGAVMLFLFNLVGQSFTWHLPINFITAAITGFLGLPGLAVLVIMKLLIFV